ncbi:hypothetical protein BVIR_787 [Blastochloris viridis]|uniref:Uncharacterized protein n=1 Tax=Blastochloris viridis TaxID=1079 RepID=A0A0P0J593_BLAVI|nr:hypothetical protein BVIR_787 [Blastochloris viridis]CUU41243.1 hypothetical protein BVIRIDIS_02320 [Blastochloris viridis]
MQGIASQRGGANFSFVIPAERQRPGRRQVFVIPAERSESRDRVQNGHPFWPAVPGRGPAALARDDDRSSSSRPSGARAGIVCRTDTPFGPRSRVAGLRPLPGTTTGLRHPGRAEREPGSWCRKDTSFGRRSRVAGLRPLPGTTTGLRHPGRRDAPSRDRAQKGHLFRPAVPGRGPTALARDDSRGFVIPDGATRRAGIVIRKRSPFCKRSRVAQLRCLPGTTREGYSAASTCGRVLPVRAFLSRSATRNASSIDCSALRRGSQ